MSTLFEKPGLPSESTMANLSPNGTTIDVPERERVTPVGSGAGELCEESFTGDLSRTGSGLLHSLEITKQAIEERLEAIARLEPEIQMREARKLSVELFGSRERAAGFIESVTEQLAKGQWETATNFNPNGFFKMSLAKVDGVALRLHFNSRTVDVPEGGRVEENVHDHRWCFISTLLTGRFEHEIYKPAEKGEEGARMLHQYTYAPRGGKELFEMGYEGPAYLKPIRTIIPDPYKPFSLAATVIHKAGYPLQDTEMTVTAVITLENRGREFNYVWADDEIHAKISESHGTTPTPRCDENVQLDLLFEISKALAKR